MYAHSFVKFLTLKPCLQNSDCLSSSKMSFSNRSTSSSCSSFLNLVKSEFDECYSSDITDDQKHFEGFDSFPNDYSFSEQNTQDTYNSEESVGKLDVPDATQTFENTDVTPQQLDDDDKDDDGGKEESVKSMNESGSSLKCRATDLLVAISINFEEKKKNVVDLTFRAMKEFMKMASIREEPLWVFDADKNIETLNNTEYLMKFGNVYDSWKEIMKLGKSGPSAPLPCYWHGQSCNNISCSYGKGGDLDRLSSYVPHPVPNDVFHREGSIHTALVQKNPLELVQLLMNLKLWSTVFSEFVSRATTVCVFMSPGTEGNYDETLQVISAEFHIPSPLAPSRESYFARYCKRLGYGMWVIVDVSLESLVDLPSTLARRLPSGCLIEQISNDSSKVTWIEHVEVDNRQVRPILRPLVTSGFAYGAKRWVSTLVRECERSAALMATFHSSTAGDGVPDEGRRSMLKLAERMMRSFRSKCSGMKTKKWMRLPASIAGAGPEIGFLVTYNGCNHDQGNPPGSAIVFGTTLKLPISPINLFDFLRDENNLLKWDIISKGKTMKEIARTNYGKDNMNRVSLIQVNESPEKIARMYVQESCRDATDTCYVVFAPMDVMPFSRVLSGGNPDCVPILPSGFVVLPDVSTMTNGTSTASLLTIIYHFGYKAVNHDFIPTHTMNAMKNIITQAITSINKDLMEVS